ncbi:MAG: hypothetical protein ACYDH5_07160 [Acidimicrobiales bacterium]
MTLAWVHQGYKWPGAVGGGAAQPERLVDEQLEEYSVAATSVWNLMFV